MKKNKIFSLTLISLLRFNSNRRSCRQSPVPYGTGQSLQPNGSVGFTLIELLVVVAIISVLITIGINSFSKLQINARDAKRKSDLSIIQSALEQYHADQRYYPPSISPGSALQSVSRTYLNLIPNDPSNGTTAPYIYFSFTDAEKTSACTGSDCVTYCLYANMENSSSSIDTSCANQSGYNYEVVSP